MDFYCNDIPDEIFLELGKNIYENGIKNTLEINKITKDINDIYIKIDKNEKKLIELKDLNNNITQQLNNTFNLFDLQKKNNLIKNNKKIDYYLKFKKELYQLIDKKELELMELTKFKN